MEGNQTWFKQQPKNQAETAPNQTRKRKRNCQAYQPTESVLFIPYTPNSELKAILTSLERQVNGNRRTGKIRIVERAGPTISEILGNRTPWTNEWCHRPNANPTKENLASVEP